jgi:hypothetical protein
MSSTEEDDLWSLIKRDFDESTACNLIRHAPLRPVLVRANLKSQQEKSADIFLLNFEPKKQTFFRKTKKIFPQF